MDAPDPAFWDKIAERYAARPVADPAAFERKIEQTKARLTPDSVVLDIGCGTGSLALILAPFARQVHGLDLSSEMTRIARGKAEAQGVHNVAFHAGAFDGSGPFEPGSVDVLCAFSILHLLPDRAAALARIFELLRPGGSFVSSTVCLGGSRVPLGPFLALMRFFGKAPPVQVFDAARLRREIEDAGFVDLEAPDVGAKPDIAFLLARKPAPPAA